MSEHVAIERRRQAIYGWILLSPAAILLTTFAFYPSLATLWSSLFSRGTRRRPSEFVGGENYADLFADPTFWKVVTNNLIYAGATIPISIAIALAMALWANSKIPARGFVRTAYFTPTVLPMIAAANLWLFFYTPGLGVLDQIGSFFGMPSINWLGQPETALWAVIIVTIWKEAGFFMIFYLAALQTIPPQLSEAAKIEGASAGTVFWRITFPLLMPTTLFVSINAVINSFRMVDHIFVLTGGGPDNASSLLLFYIYETSFRFWDTAYGATLTVVMLALLGLLAIGQFLIFDKKVHYK